MSERCYTDGCLHHATGGGMYCDTCRLAQRIRMAHRYGIEGDMDAILRRRMIRRWWRTWRDAVALTAIVALTVYGLLRVEDARRRQDAMPVVVRVTDNRYYPAKATTRKPLLPRLAGTEELR